MADPILAVIDLEVRYGAVPAVRDVTFHLERGEMVAIVGPNGAGKSTTLLSIMGALRPSGGDIRLEERSIAGLPPETVARSGLALVPEGRKIFADFTVEENLKLGLLARTSTESPEEALRKAYALFPVIGDMLTRTAGHLSGGQQQQLAIARALVADPKVLLLDEPTLGLAPMVMDALFEALRSIRDQGVTVLIIEQRAKIAVQYADRTHVMRDGELTMQLSPQDAGDAERLSAAYFG